MTKHVELDIYFVCDLVLHKKLVIQHLPATEQVADILTKPLSHANFQRLCSKLNVRAPTVIGLRGVLRWPTNICKL